MQKIKYAHKNKGKVLWQDNIRDKSGMFRTATILENILRAMFVGVDVRTMVRGCKLLITCVFCTTILYFDRLHIFASIICTDSKISSFTLGGLIPLL